MTPFGSEPMGDVFMDRPFNLWPRRMGEEFSPSINLYEKDGDYHLEAELPGVKKEDIKIDVQDDMVTLTGRKESSKEEEGADYYIRESSVGSFSRTFRLPGVVDQDKVDATFKDGRLHMKMPVKESKERKKIEIK